MITIAGAFTLLPAVRASTSERIPDFRRVDVARLTFDHRRFRVFSELQQCAPSRINDETERANETKPIVNQKSEPRSDMLHLRKTACYFANPLSLSMAFSFLW